MEMQDAAKKAARCLAANDNAPKIDPTDVPVFDRRDYREPLVSRPGEWSPPRSARVRGEVVWRADDGPTQDHFIGAGVAWYSSYRYSG